jgi:hypothetical protein
VLDGDKAGRRVAPQLRRDCVPRSPPA